MEDDDLRMREHPLGRQELDIGSPREGGVQHLLEERRLVLTEIANLGHVRQQLLNIDSLRLVGALEDLAALEPFKVWEGVIARNVEGERLNLAVVELEPSSVVPEHSHDNEQLGIVLRGSLTFRVGDEVRDLEAGGIYSIAPNVPHAVLRTGPEGAVVLDVFAPARADWRGLERVGDQPPLWP